MLSWAVMLAFMKRSFCSSVSVSGQRALAPLGRLDSRVESWCDAIFVHGAPLLPSDGLRCMLSCCQQKVQEKLTAFDVAFDLISRRSDLLQSPDNGSGDFHQRRAVFLERWQLSCLFGVAAARRCVVTSIPLLQLSEVLS